MAIPSHNATAAGAFCSCETITVAWWAVYVLICVFHLSRFSRALRKRPNK